jgi:hypothetical protein
MNMKALSKDPVIANTPAIRGQRTAGVAAESLQSSHRVAAIVFFLAFILSAGYGYWCLKSGWLPQDDGTLAQSALRVLNGELPHRDFVENYTGGLSYLHALAFRLAGINLVSLRICVFAFFLLWIAGVLYIASRMTSPLPAAGIGLLCAVWSLPQYPAAMPSWYNLFFAGLGAAALLRYLEAGKAPWMFLAGLCGGFSFLVKITGLYYVAAVFLFLVFREQQLSGAGQGETGRRTNLYSAFAIFGVAAFLGSILWLIRRQLNDREFVHFLWPAAVLALLLMLQERTLRTRTNAERFAGLFQMVAPFLLGVLLPVLSFLALYAVSHSLGAFFTNVFGLAQSRAAGLGGLVRPPEPHYLIYATIPLLLLALATCCKRAGAAYLAFGVAALLAVVLLDRRLATWRSIWFSASVLTPLVVTLGAGVLAFRPPLANKLTPLRQQQLFLLLALAALCSLVQFPFAAPIYFCYSAPLTAMALAAVLATRKPESPGILGAVLVFYLLFAVVRLQPTAIYAHWEFGSTPATETLNLRRAGGLQVEAATTFEQMTALVQQYSANQAIVATPESPEVYFLTETKNATSSDGFLDTAQLLQAMRLNSVRVVVLNLRSTFSGSTLTPEVQRELASRFPHSVKVGRYLVSWR